MNEVLNYIDGKWVKPEDSEYFDVINPATGECIAQTPLCGAAEVAAAAEAAAAALPGWRQTPVQERVQPLFKIRDLLKSRADEIARTITMEAGQTLDESRAEMVRAVE